MGNWYNCILTPVFWFNSNVRPLVKKKAARPAITWTLTVFWLLLIGWLAFFWNLGSNGLIDETEPLFAEASRQMTVTGDWITPFFNGKTRFDKPPLIYWSQAIAYLSFGVNEWAVRLPSALAGFALTGTTFYTLRCFAMPKPLVASLGAAIVALNPITLFFGRTGYSDMLLSACLGGALLAFFLGYAQPEQRGRQQRWYLAFYVLIALAVLTKGPIGFVLPGLIIGSFLLYLGKAKDAIAEMNLVRGGLIVLTIALPWYILVTLSNGEAYINSFFGYHNFERFTNVVNKHSGPWYFHLLVVLVGFAPWSIDLFPGLAQVQILQRRQWQQQHRSNHLGLFAWFWFVIVLGFFSIATTKYFSYTLPLIPAAAILVALWWSQKIEQRDRNHLFSLVTIGFFLLLAVACFLSPQWLNDDSSMPNLGVRIQQAGLSNIGAAIWGASAIAGTFLVWQRQSYWLWAVKLLGFVAFLSCVVMPASTIVDLERQLPLRQIAQSVIQVKATGEEVVMITNAFEKPSMVFYTQQPVTFLSKSAKAVPYLQQAKAKSVLLIATDQALQNTGLTPNQYQQISTARMYQLVRVSTTEVR